MSFTVQSMLGGQALVSGTDSLGNEGKTILSTVEWDAVKADLAVSTAQSDFDAAVEAVFGPIIEAAEKAEAAVRPVRDPVEYVVVKEPVEGVAPETGEFRELSVDSIILRLIEEGKTDRLTWVDESTLGVLATV